MYTRRVTPRLGRRSASLRNQLMHVFSCLRGGDGRDVTPRDTASEPRSAAATQPAPRLPRRGGSSGVWSREGQLQGQPGQVKILQPQKETNGACTAKLKGEKQFFKALVSVVLLLGYVGLSGSTPISSRSNRRNLGKLCPLSPFLLQVRFTLHTSCVACVSVRGDDAVPGASSTTAAGDTQ